MPDSTNIPTGLNITSQIPLNIKENIINEATLAYLGIDDNLAFTYHDQLIITCLEEGTKYIWREVQAGEENTGLIPLDFTYPNGLITYGIDYSNRTFNFFILPNGEQTYTVENIGDGVEIYKDSTVVGNNIQFNIRTLKSNTHNIILSDDGNSIYIEQVDNGIPSFIVNSDYTGIEELGTASKPFKNLQNALTARIGTGTNLIPQFSNTIVTIQKDINIFTGSLAQSGLDLLILKGVTLISNPTYGQYLLDLDNDATLPPGYTVFNNTSSVNISITVDEGAGILLQKQGFKNRGTLLNTFSSIGKQIHLLGKGFIHIDNDLITTSPSIRKIIDINSDNQAGYYNDGNVAHFDVQCTLSTYNTKFYTCGLNGNLYLTDNNFNFGDTVITYNVNTVLFEVNGGRITENNTNTTIISKAGLILNKLYTFSNNSTHIFVTCNVDGNCNYLFSNEDTTNSSLYLTNNVFNIVISLGIISSLSVLWTNLRFSNNYFYAGSFNYTQGTLFANNLNFIGSNIVETLNTYPTRSAAITDGLFKGCKFINESIVTAGSFISGVEYKIETIGTTDFTLIGAASNTVGLYFTASGVGTGTGTASNSYIDIII